MSRRGPVVYAMLGYLGLCAVLIVCIPVGILTGYTPLLYAAGTAFVAGMLIMLGILAYELWTDG